MGDARYDGLAEWYERDFMAGPLAAVPRDGVLRLLGDGPGRLLDVGCGTGTIAGAVIERAWEVVGVDVSADMLRLAAERGVEVVQADAAALPFEDASFDAAVSTWLHTDVDDFGGVTREVARVLRPGGRFVYVGAHPCFVGPHCLFAGPRGVPELHVGYWQTGRYTDGPAIVAKGLRARVGATHLPLGRFVQSFLDAGLTLERLEELETGEYPYTIALRCRR